MRNIALCSLTLTMLAQPPNQPNTYTIAETTSFFGTPVEMKIYRNGSKAVVESNGRLTLFDLQSHTSLSWDPANLTAPCGQASFSGDWGDPFAMSAEAGKQEAQQTGTETLAGFPAKIFEDTNPHAMVKVWVEPKSNLVLKLQMTPPGGAVRTLLEVTSASFGPPPAAVFTPPPGCGHLPSMPGQKVLAPEFADAIMGPASSGSCTVLFRVVRAGSMDPVTNFQVALDPNVDAQHPASYTTGISQQGRATFSGGGLRELTSQLHNGVLRIDNAPAQFHIDVAFGNAGTSSALIYRQCPSPQTVLLFVVKNPGKISDRGDWLWVRSGKYATVP